MLIVEDGTVVAGANSYQTLADARTEAALSGILLATDDTVAETQLVQAFRYLTDNYESKVSGQRVSAAQTSMLPRAFMYGNGFLISDDVIPDEFKRAQVMAAAVVNEGVDLNGYESGGDLSGFSVDGVYSETYQSGGTSPSVKMPAVEKTLSGFFDNVGTLSRGNYW